MQETDPIAPRVLLVAGLCVVVLGALTAILVVSGDREDRSRPSARVPAVPTTQVPMPTLTAPIESIAQEAAVVEAPVIARLGSTDPTRGVRLRAIAAEDARQAQARRLAGVGTVAAALRRAVLLRAISWREHERRRALWNRAAAVQRRLGGRRGAELGVVLEQVQNLAARRLLSPSRLDPAFLAVKRNLEVWQRRPMPVPGRDVRFAGDDRVYRYIAGQGVQLHPLASFGVANALARRCISTRTPCRKRRLRRLLDDLVAVSVQRAGYRAWEYGYRFGSGSPPWVSGMAQGTAVQAFARGARALDDRRYLAVARGGMGAFMRPTPAGVAAGPAERPAFVMYSFSPGQRILNGELQAVAGLHDLAVLSGDRRAQTLYARGERAVRASVAAYDTGAWSRYSLGGKEANLHYHQFTTVQLRGLCRRTKQGAYCRAKQRFRRYQREAPTISVWVPRRMRVRRATVVRFAVSKVGRAWVRIDGPRGRVLQRRVAVSRGAYVVRWTPPRRGTYVVRVDARGLSGRTGRRGVQFRVLPLRPKTRAADATTR